MRRKARPTVLVDVDGVLADFNQAYLNVVNELMGTKYKVADLTEWDMDLCLKIPDKVAKAAEARICEPGFCAQLPEIEGAIHTVNRLSRVSDVVFVTAPYPGPHWVHERTEWLRMRAESQKVVHTHHKEYVRGDCLVDDKLDNLMKWSAAWPDGLPVLYARPYNAGIKGWLRRDWTSLVEELECLL